MAKQPSQKKILKETFDKEQQKWVDTLLDPLNRFMDEVASAFNRQLTIKQNLNADIKTIICDGSFPQKFKWDLKARPVGATIMQCREVDEDHTTFSDPISLDWEFTNDGMVQINNIPGLTATTSNKFNVTVLLITG